MISCFVILCLCILALGCNKHIPNGPEANRLIMVSSHPLDVHEPSGLALDVTRLSLWTVGKNPQRIYRISLDGKVLETLDFKGDDMEGIACNPSDSTLLVVEEKRRVVVHLEMDGTVLNRSKLDLAGKENSGLEGISIGGDGTIHILNEKDPGLFISLDDNLSIKSKLQLSFAKDYSAMDYNPGQDNFWILSDKSRALYLWHPVSGVATSYPLALGKAEGIAVDETSGLIYIVSESEERLYVYAIAPAP